MATEGSPGPSPSPSPATSVAEVSPAGSRATSVDGSEEDDAPGDPVVFYRKFPVG